MKKIFWGLGLSILLTSFFLSCGDINLGVDLFPSGLEGDFCPQIKGQYVVEKEVKRFNCEKKGNPVQIQNPGGALPLNTSLQISQGGCKIWAEEANWKGTMNIPYWGEVDDDDNFFLRLRNPENINLLVELKINGAIEKCNFNGEINWEGKAEGEEDELTGEIYYALDQRPEEGNKNCPDTCNINMEFKATWIDELPEENDEE